MKLEWTKALEEYKKRNIDIIPVTIENVMIPDSLLKHQVINISNSSKGVEKLITRLKRKNEISFEEFDYLRFEDLIFDLLKEYKFFEIERTPISMDGGYDFIAKSKSKNPFGQFRIEKWIIEVKLYKHNRFSINQIKELLNVKEKLNQPDLNFLLITNSQLSSVTKQYLKDYEKTNNTNIELIDGQFLTNLISNRKKLVDKYFRK